MKSHELFEEYKFAFNDFLKAMSEDFRLSFGEAEKNFLFNIEDSFCDDDFIAKANKIVSYLKEISLECKEFPPIVKSSKNLQESFKKMILQKLIIRNRKKKILA